MGRREGKVALISGGAKGMGEIEARMFAEEGSSLVIRHTPDDTLLHYAALFLSIKMLDSAGEIMLTSSSTSSFLGQSLRSKALFFSPGNKSRFRRD